MNTDKITTIIGAIIAVLVAFNGAVVPAATGGTINWVSVGVAVATAIFGYFTNKSKR